MSSINEGFTPNFFRIIDENFVRNRLQICGSECLLKFNFQENSTSFKSCNFNNHYINITNQYLSDRQNTGTIAVNFAKEDYWFSDILITPPGFLFDRVISAPSDPLYDPSAFSLVIICVNRARTKILTISRYITKRQTTTRNLASYEVKNLINNLHETFVPGNDNAQRMCNANDINIREQISTININNFIPTDEKFIYNISDNKVNDNNVSQYSVLFPRSDPIIITSDTMDKLNGIFTQNNNLNAFQRRINGERIQITQDTPKTFISASKPINNLFDDDGDNIFIRCQPTDTEGNILVSGQSVSPPEEEFKIDIDKLMDNNSNIFIGAFIGIIIMIVIMKGGEYVLKSAPKIVLGDK